MIVYEDILKKIGLNFRAERMRKALSQEKFAEIANVHTNYIGKVERGEQNLTIKKIVALANSLDISIEKIFYFECRFYSIFAVGARNCADFHMTDCTKANPWTP